MFHLVEHPIMSYPPKVNDYFVHDNFGRVRNSDGTKGGLQLFSKKPHRDGRARGWKILLARYLEGHFLQWDDKTQLLG